MKRWVLIAIAAIAFVGFTALGVWQVERRAWKVGLIERVEARVHAAPVAAPGPQEWPSLTRDNAEYRRVRLTGRWLEGRETLVRAVTELGEGFWLMEPMSTDGGFVVLVNRGFVPQGWRDSRVARSARVADAPHAAEPTTLAKSAAHAAELTASADRAHAAKATPSADAVTVTGLLRISEPHGAFLRANAPSQSRWYSRDVDAISHAQHLTQAAPYFVDAEAVHGTGPETSQPPVAGLTVIHFRNSHLQYVFTWFALALMALWLGVRVVRAR